MSSFAGIEMGKRALNAFRLGMQTVGHNISNMSTEGYSRQRAVYSTVTPMDLPNTGQVGQGVQVSEITRIRDEFLDFQFRSNQATLGYWDKINSLYNSLQTYIAEPAGEGVRAAMDTFFSAMQTVQEKPEDTSARRSLVESAQSLGGVLGTLVSGFDTYSKSLNQEILTSVDEANQMLHEIASLNKQIYHAEALGQNANDLLDQRDVLLDKLSKMMDISYQEPLQYGDVKGEFFLTLNGRTLIQGDHVRELRAHAFQWDGQVYYDVQVSENEFDIVDNCSVADVLAAGAEGVYQLNVNRLANGESWTVGGGDAYCLETRAVTTAEFADGTLLDGDTMDTTVPRKLSFRTLMDSPVLDSDGNPVLNADGTQKTREVSVNLTIKIDWDTDNNDKWLLRAEKDGQAMTLSSGITADSGDSVLTVEELAQFINDVIADDSDLTATGMTAEALTNASSGGASLRLEAGEGHPMEVTDYSGMLGSLSLTQVELTDTPMRTKPMTVDEALGISGSFRIQVGTQGTRVTSKIIEGSSATGLNAGEIMGAGETGERHTFRVGVDGDQIDITAAWNDSTQKWELTSDVFNAAGSSIRALPSTYPAVSSSDRLTVEELTGFLSKALPDTGDAALTVHTGSRDGTVVQFNIESRDAHLISITDVEGSLAERLGMANQNPVITIDVAETDSLTVIRNKINEKYQAEFGLTEPEQWLHASLQQSAEDQSWYLTMASNVPGEAQRITLMGSEDGNMQVLRRLGLTQNREIGRLDDGTQVYREVTAIATEAQDASFTINGVRYLSSDNMFNEARRVPAANNGGGTDYSASSLTQVVDGMWFNLKSRGITSITVRHHVNGGSIKGLEEARDEAIPNLKGTLDEMAFGLVKNLNACQYSGYGIGSDINTTGVAFFDVLGTKAGAATKLSVNELITADTSLIGAAMGKKDDSGRAVSGVSGGSGDGTNAARMAGLSSARVLGDGTLSLGGAYDSMLAQIGSEAGNAKLMYTAQANISDQIDQQRQSVSGVNLDEELMNIIVLNRAFGAMSRYVNVMDEMLNTIINGFGLVGR